MKRGVCLEDKGNFFYAKIVPVIEVFCSIILAAFEKKNKRAKKRIFFYLRFWRHMRKMDF